jgi:pSer/pThr/pTyr-binding forkhead associated (FHA) protein
MAGTPSHNEAILVICSGELEGTSHVLFAEETLIGRAPTTQIQLPDESVSREHAFLSYDEAEASWVVEDLQSTNGTKLNGKRVRSASLGHGDIVQIGHTKLKFLLKNEG